MSKQTVGIKNFTSSKIVGDVKRTDSDELSKIHIDNSDLNSKQNNYKQYDDRRVTLTKPSVLRFFFNTQYNDSKQVN